MTTTDSKGRTVLHKVYNLSSSWHVSQEWTGIFTSSKVREGFCLYNGRPYYSISTYKFSGTTLLKWVVIITQLCVIIGTC